MSIKHWWEIDAIEDKHRNIELATSLTNRVEAIQSRNARTFRNMEEYERMYQSFTSPDLRDSGVSESTAQDLRMTYNLVKSVVDTAHAMIAKHRYKATFSTRGGDYKKSRQAKLLDKFMAGGFEAANIYEVGPDVFRDACIYGTGVMRTDYGEDGTVQQLRVRPLHIFVDELFCDHSGNKPPEIIERSMATKTALMADYPQYEYEICEETSGSGPDDHRTVYEAFYVGHGISRYVKVCDNLVLEDKEWKLPMPYEVMYWCKPLAGFYGVGLAQDLRGRQDRLTQLYTFIKQCQDKFLAPIIMVDGPQGSLEAGKIDGIPGTILAAKGGKIPQVVQFPGTPPEAFNWLEALKSDGHGEVGISAASAQSILPQGLQSAPAQREYASKEGQRFALVSQRYEKMFTNAAHTICAFYALANKRKTANRTKMYVKDRSWVAEIPWPEVDLDEDKFIITIQASAFDSLTPAGRIQAVLELTQAGFVMNSAEARRMLNHPDLEQADYFNDAFIDDADCTVDKLLDGIPVIPSPIQDLNMVMQRVRAAYLRESNRGENGAPQEILGNLLTFMDMATALMAQSQASVALGPDGQPIAAAAAESTQGLGGMFAGNRSSVKGL